MPKTGFLRLSLASRLNNLEDEQIAELARSGNHKASEYLLKKYRSFVEAKARSYFLAGAEREDVVQEGMIGLYKAIRDFCPQKGVRFRSFAQLCVTRQIITAVKSANRGKHVPLNEYISLQRIICSDNDYSLIDVVADSRSTDPEQMMIRRRMFQSLRHLESDEMSSLEHGVMMQYLEGRSYQEIARDLGCSSKTIDNALQRAKRKMSHVLCEV